MNNIESTLEQKKAKFFECLQKKLEHSDWDNFLIKEIEEECSFKIGYHKILFEGEIQDIASSFERWLDTQMLLSLNNTSKPKKIREQIALGLETRIMHVVSKEVITKNTEFFAKAKNIAAGSEIACSTCDIIWRYAGDESTDFNFYTKRGLLLPVYVAARSYYLSDNSDNHEDTKNFIKKSLDNIIKIASLKSKVKIPNKEDIPILRLFTK